eukprot:2220332-Pleurochrysis_carterae.AAC.1
MTRFAENDPGGLQKQAYEYLARIKGVSGVGSRGGEGRGGLHGRLEGQADAEALALSRVVRLDEADLRTERVARDEKWLGRRMGRGVR